MVVRLPGISFKLKVEMKSMANKKSRLVIAIILMLSLVSFFSIPASVFAVEQDSSAQIESSGSDDQGYDSEGFKGGFDKDGFKDGYDKDGRDKDGFDKDGRNKDGFDKGGHDKDGYDKDGRNKDGFDKGGHDKDGYDKGGYDKDGRDKDGYDKDGRDKDGYDKDGFDKDGHKCDTSTKKDGTLTINKVVTGVGSSNDQLFSFTIQKWYEKEKHDGETVDAHWGDSKTVQASAAKPYISGKKDGGEKYKISETAQQNGYTRSGSASQEITIDGDKSITFTNIKDQRQPVSYIVTYVALTGGAISGTAIQTLVENTSTSAVTAVPANGYHFVSWDNASTVATRSDSVTGNVTYTATFALNETKPVSYTVTYEALTGGTISGPAVQILVENTSTSEVVAVPVSGYHFVSWNDNTSTPSNRSDVVKENVTYTATFAADVIETSIRHTTKSTPDVPVIIEEPEVLPAGEAVIPVMEDKTPGAPAELPKTGGFDPSLLYGLGALLTGSGLVIRRRKDK